MITTAISAVMIIATCAVGMFSPTQIEYTDGPMVINNGLPRMQVNGLIWGSYSEHEHGHYLQQQDIGDAEYYAMVALPSMISTVVKLVVYMVSGYEIDYYALPWEADANARVMEYNR